MPTQSGLMLFEGDFNGAVESPRSTDEVEEARTPGVLAWAAAVATAELGYSVMVPAPVRPLADAWERWAEVLERLGYSGSLGELLAPWAEVAGEDAAAYDATLLEQLPPE